MYYNLVCKFTENGLHSCRQYFLLSKTKPPLEKGGYPVMLMYTKNY